MSIKTFLKKLWGIGALEKTLAKGCPKCHSQDTEATGRESWDGFDIEFKCKQCQHIFIL